MAISDPSTCGHCRREPLGFAEIRDQRVCHPDYGIDCYRLVLVYGHPMPCQACCDARALLDNMDPRFARRRDADRT